MIWITIVIILSTLVGIFAERRWPDRAGIGSRKSLLILLYVVLPPVIFENLAHADFELGAGIGLALGLVSVMLVGLAAWAIAVPCPARGRARADSFNIRRRRNGSASMAYSSEGWPGGLRSWVSSRGFVWATAYARALQKDQFCFGIM